MKGEVSLKPYAFVLTTADKLLELVRRADLNMNVNDIDRCNSQLSFTVSEFVVHETDTIRNLKFSIEVHSPIVSKKDPSRIVLMEDGADIDNVAQAQRLGESLRDYFGGDWEIGYRA